MQVVEFTIFDRDAELAQAVLRAQVGFDRINRGALSLQHARGVSDFGLVGDDDQVAAVLGRAACQF